MGSKKVKVIDDSQLEELKGKEGQEDTEDKEGEELTESSKTTQPSKPSKPSKSSKPSQPSKSSEPKKESSGQQYLKVKAMVDSSKTYTLNEAIDLTKQTSYTKFDGTIEAHFNIKSKGFRTSLTLPHPVKAQKEKRLLIFADNIADLASKNQNIIVGTKQTVEKILSAELVPVKDFQMVIATPAYMTELARVAKTLGPKGLMPNPKNGTITDDVAKTLKSFEGGQIEVKCDPTAPIVHLAVGKVSWETKSIEENIETVATAVGKNSILKLTLNATMGPGIHVAI